MLGLPSTTEVGRRLPKEAFYRNLKLSQKRKAAFVHGVERIEILNSIKESTMRISAGEKVKEIMVVGIKLRDEGAAEVLVEEIAKANKHKLVFLCREPSGRESLAVLVKSVRFSPWTQPDRLMLKIQGDTLDAVWDAIVSQVSFGDTGTIEMPVETRLALADKVHALERIVSELDAKCRKAKQIGKKNEYFIQMRRAKAELEEARKELV